MAIMPGNYNNLQNRKSVTGVVAAITWEMGKLKQQLIQ